MLTCKKLGYPWGGGGGGGRGGGGGGGWRWYSAQINIPLHWYAVSC